MVHFHKYKPKAVSHFATLSSNAVMFGITAKDAKTDTEVLYVCEICNKPNVIKLSGNWELKDL